MLYQFFDRLIAFARVIFGCHVLFHFCLFWFQGGFTELVSTAEKAWVAISKRNPPDIAAIDRVKAAVSPV